MGISFRKVATGSLKSNGDFIQEGVNRVLEIQWGFQQGASHLRCASMGPEHKVLQASSAPRSRIG
jgi:hypothetical protein